MTVGGGIDERQYVLKIAVCIGIPRANQYATYVNVWNDASISVKSIIKNLFSLRPREVADPTFEREPPEHVQISTAFLPSTVDNVNYVWRDWV